MFLFKTSQKQHISNKSCLGCALNLTEKQLLYVLCVSLGKEPFLDWLPEFLDMNISNGTRIEMFRTCNLPICHIIWTVKDPNKTIM